MKIVVGLGNIGKEYENTRHNVGFMFVDYFIKQILNLSEEYKRRDNYYYLETKFNDEKVVFIKPTTYMNLSGEAISSVKKWYKVKESDIIVIYDDVDIKFGTFRYREVGSAGTHNGMRNIISVLKTENIERIRIGIENRENNEIKLMDYVLGKFQKDELEMLYNVIFKEVSEKLREVIKGKKVS